MDSKRKTTAMVLMAACMVAYAASAFGFATPIPGTLGYDFYDFADKLATGAPGFTVGMGGVALAGFCLFKQAVWPAIGSVMGTIAILKATSIVNSLGLNI